jgi:hypothetical protein
MGKERMDEIEHVACIVFRVLPVACRNGRACRLQSEDVKPDGTERLDEIDPGLQSAAEEERRVQSAGKWLAVPGETGDFGLRERCRLATTVCKVR